MLALSHGPHEHECRPCISTHKMFKGCMMDRNPCTMEEIACIYLHTSQFSHFDWLLDRFRSFIADLLRVCKVALSITLIDQASLVQMESCCSRSFKKNL